MSYRDLNQLGENRGEAFFLTALHYGQYLWQRGESARALLALARALYADLVIETAHPLPYGAIGWIIRHHPGDSFIGNPRISFQHQAERYRGERQTLRRARSWAAWHIARQAAPSLPGDPHSHLQEPSAIELTRRLADSAYPGEISDWQQALASSPSWQPGSTPAPSLHAAARAH
ncbi:MAG: hypothetical protein Q7P63_11435 [Verrucomicrobiota bacterium JB022]|nr:hypothetical protein [Verrucomicrobiota bacterium JB022]